MNRRMVTRPIAWIAALAVGVLAGARPAPAAELGEAESALARGDYARARTLLRAAKGPDRAKATALVVRADIEQGRLEQADKRASALQAISPIEGALALAEVAIRRGQYQRARTNLEGVTRRAPRRFRARYLLAQVYRRLGQDRKAYALWNQFADDYNSDKLDDRNALHMFYLTVAVAELAYRGQASFEDDVQNMLTETLKLDRANHEINLGFAELFVRAHQASDAEESVQDILAVNPHHADANAAMAELALDRHDFDKTRRHLEIALKTDSSNERALIARARLAATGHDWSGANQSLKKALATNPNSTVARAELAAIARVRGDLTTFERERARVLALNSKDSLFFRIAANRAVREHRYADAITLAHKAIAVDPNDYHSMELLGLGYLRRGDDRQGVEWLRRAWKGDPLNRRTFNLLNLFEETIANHYESEVSRHFRIRYPKKERPTLARYITPFLEKTYKDMVRRYRFTPKGPVVVELFTSSEDYSVRTIGEPNLGALAVCFGQVITSISPSNGNIDWAMVLWHELAHVFAIQMSNYRVARWYTEGLSEYETLSRRPEWRRENDRDLWMALQRRELPSVAELDQEFLRGQSVLRAYYQSAVTVEYLVKTYGFDKVVEGLKHYGANLETPQVIQRMTGLTVRQFDREFRAYLQKRLAVFARGYRLPPAPKEDAAALTARLKADPSDQEIREKLLLRYYEEGDAPGSMAMASEILKRSPDHKIALLVAGDLSRRTGAVADAKRHLSRLLKVGGDGYPARRALGAIAATAGDVKGAATHFNQAKSYEPERVAPYAALAAVYDKAGAQRQALTELEGVVARENMALDPLRKLVKGYQSLGQWRKVVRYGEWAVRVYPFDGPILLALGDAHLKLRKPGGAKAALYAFDSALVLPLRRPARAHLGRARALVALRKRKLAKRAVMRALQLEPEMAEARALSKKLR